MMARPKLFRYRLVLALIPAMVVGLGLFLVTALLVRQHASPATPVASQAVIMLQRVPPHLAVVVGKADSRRSSVAMAKFGASRSLLRVPLPSLFSSLTLPTFGLSRVKARVPLQFFARGKLNKLAVDSTASFLGLDGRGHGHQKWVEGGGGLFYLPDSGVRVRQLRYSCSHMPMSNRSGTTTAFVSALVTHKGRVKDVSVTGDAAVKGAQANSLRKAMEKGWRFQPLVIRGKVTAFRLRFVAIVEASMENVIAVHCWWGRFNAAHRGSLMPTWIVQVPKKGLPIAYAYIAPQHLGESPGGLALAAGEPEDKP